MVATALKLYLNEYYKYKNVCHITSEKNVLKLFTKSKIVEEIILLIYVYLFTILRTKQNSCFFI